MAVALYFLIFCTIDTKSLFHYNYLFPEKRGQQRNRSQRKIVLTAEPFSDFAWTFTKFAGKFEFRKPVLFHQAVNTV